LLVTVNNRLKKLNFKSKSFTTDRVTLYYNFAAESFLSKKLCSRLHSIKVEFNLKKGKVGFLSHSLGDLEVTFFREL